MCAAALLILALGTPGSAGVGGERRTLERAHDAVVVATAPFAGETTERFRLLRLRNARREPVPFQFDRRGADGEIDVTSGDRFELDADDELVFLARDTGDRAGASFAPEGARSVFEIEVTDPRDRSKGWVYLVRFAGEPPPVSPVRYVEFDLEANEARSELYRVRYAPGRSHVTGLHVATNGDAPGVELIDRMELRIHPTFSFFLTRWSPRFTENDFRVHIDGVRVGPVRAIRRVRQSLDLGRFFPQLPNGTTYSFYYRSSLVTPSTLSIPWLAVQTLADFRFEGMSVAGPGAAPIRYWDAGTDEGLRLDREGPRHVEREGDHRWFVLSGARAAAVHMLEIPDDWREWGIERGTVLRRGSDPAAGYSLLRMTRLEEGGRYDMRSTLVLLPESYRPGSEEPALAMIAAPLETTVRRLR